MAELFQTTPQNITLHLKAIFDEGELTEEATCKDYLQVRQEGPLDDVRENIAVRAERGGRSRFSRALIRSYADQFMRSPRPIRADRPQQSALDRDAGRMREIGERRASTPAFLRPNPPKKRNSLTIPRRKDETTAGQFGSGFAVAGGRECERSFGA
jgi:hypothetical protein